MIIAQAMNPRGFSPQPSLGVSINTLPTWFWVVGGVAAVTAVGATFWIRRRAQDRIKKGRGRR